ncbi:hypothetical protein EG329_010130, partial [Mollisiaceae sp. DMI_Dod_QoI]
MARDNTEQAAAPAPEQNPEQNPKRNPTRRVILLERADLDGNSEDEDLLSTTEYERIITEHPDELLQEIRELVKQQRELNLAYVDFTKKSEHFKEKVKRKDAALA